MSFKFKEHIYGDVDQRIPTVVNSHSPLSFRRGTPKLRSSQASIMSTLPRVSCGDV